MRRKPLAAVLALLSAALVLGGNALLDAGWGSALRSIADRVLPNPEIAMWAPAPEPGSHASSYADATGAGANYVYLVDAADDRGNIRELQLIFFGRESNGEGWLEIEARGGSGVRYRACNAAEAPAAVSVNVNFTISTNAFSPIAPTRMRRIRQRGCAAFGA